MLNKEKTLQKMLEHFPRWMDIRKRAKSSMGGQLLESVAEETALIQEAIDDYKKDFFIESYFGKEEEIVAFAKRIQIGLIDIKRIKILSHNLKHTDELNVFYGSTGYYYYEDGYLFFRLEDVTEETLQYSIDNYIFNGQLEKMHVWNIYDEFATFVGLQRHEMESNKCLENRILNVFKSKMNGTEDGLRHSILTEIMEIAPDITLDDIKIEGVTPENLRKKYDEFNTVLDTLAKINRDAYAYKRWDIDPWYYSIKSIDYIPHAWDVAIPAFKDGVGKQEDLAITLSTPNDTTDATAMFYKRNREQIQSYVETSKIDTDIRLDLVKLNNELKPIQAKFQISATQAYDITQSDIGFEYSDVGYFEGTDYIEDYIELDESGEPIQDLSYFQVIDHSILPPNQKFKVVFEPDSNISMLSINECSITTDGVKQSLLIADDNFNVVDDKAYYKHCKLYATKIKDFSYTSNIENGPRGLVVSNNARDGVAKLDLTGYEKEHIFIQYDCNKASVFSSLSLNYSLNNFIVNNETFESIDGPGETSLMFNLKCNALEFNIRGKCYINIYKNGELFRENIFITEDTFYALPISRKIDDYKVEIVSTSNLEKVVIYNMKYSSYEISESLEFGELELIQGYYTIPDIANNVLTISMRTEFEYSPILLKVFIGTPYDRIKYKTIEFQSGDNSKIKIRKTNLKATLVQIENNTENLDGPLTQFNYTPYVEYKALYNGAQLLLNTSRFVKISKLTCSNASAKPYIEDGKMKYLLEFKQNAIASELFISGYSADNIRTMSLINLFNLDSTEDRLYISNLVDGFVSVSKDGTQRKHKLSDIPSIKESFRYGVFTYTNVPIEYSQVFIKTYSEDNDNYFISSDKYHGSIKEVYLKSKDKQKHIAYNEQRILQRRRNFIHMDDTFSPFLPVNKLMLYEIKVLTNGIDILFHDEYDPSTTFGNWSIGRKPLSILADFDIFNANNYLAETIKFTLNTQLKKTMPFPKTITLDNGTIINPYQYMISSEDGYSINYMTIDPNKITIEQAPEYYGSEIIYKYANDGFNKLEHSNVDQLLIFGVYDYESEEFIPITSNDYDILKEEGVIIWKDTASWIDNIYGDIYIRYTLKIPNTIVASDDILYDKTNHVLEGYSLLKTIEINGVGSEAPNNFVDLTKEYAFKTSDRIVVRCTNPNFDAYSTIDGLYFKRTNKDNVLYAKSGYYYIDGIEYYMFANEISDKADKVMNVKFYNTTKKKDGIYMQKTSNNFINNSLLLLEGLGDVFSKNFVTNSNVSGASSLNSITACSSFNHWFNVASQLSFTDGKNGIGIRMKPTEKDGYSYLNITDKLYKYTKISFYAKGNIKAYIGKEDKNINARFIDTNNITIDAEIEHTPSSQDILEHNFYPKENVNYYLIIKGDGIIDDIIICNNEALSPLWDIHKKNIDTIGFNVREHIIEDYVNRMFFYNTNGYKRYGAELDRDNCVVNSSMINWGKTKIKEYTTAEDWIYSELNNVSSKNNMVVSKNSPGYILTEPIFIGDLRMLKSISVRINDVEFEQMSGFNTDILSSDDYYGTYETRASFNKNIGIIEEKEIKKLKKYIRIKIKMPADKIIHKLILFSEYKESKEATPVEKISSNGSIVSEIYDAQYLAKYKLNDINIEKISNKEDVRLQIRAARSDNEENVWTDWKDIQLSDNLNVANQIIFDNYRYFQMKISLRKRDAFAQINYFDLKVVK